MRASFSPCSHPQASLLVQSFWETRGTPRYGCEIILPKGVVELIFSFEDALVFSRADRGHGLTPRCFINGMSDARVQLDAPRFQSFFGVVLHPAAVKSVLKAPGGVFLNSMVDLELIDPAFGSLWHRLAEAADFAGKVAITEEWMSRHQRRSLHQQELAISGFLQSRAEAYSVAALASHFCYSSRQLSRKAHELFGMSTEGLIRYRRYLQAMNLVHNTETSLTDIGYHCNFYDQAHFIREFKDFTGLTPGEYRKQKSGLAAHLYQ